MITLGQIQVHAGQPERNLDNIAKMAEQTPEGGLLILPEMAVPGYMIGDRWNSTSYIQECHEFNEDILDILEARNITGIWGNIDFDETKKNEDGTIRKYNAAFVGQGGKVVAKQYKTLLPNYRMFDDKRYFTSLKTLAEEEGKDLIEYYQPIEIEIDGVKTRVAVLICEDIWNINGDYGIDPLEMTKSYNPDLIAVTSASPFGLNKFDMRSRVLKNASKNTKLAYVNPIGIQNNGKNVFVFEGGSAIYENRKIKQGVKDYTTNTSTNIEQEKSEIEQIYETTIYYIQEFFKNIGQTKVVIGLSGGLDSAVSAALCTIALGAENVTTVNMPSRFNSDTTKDLAKECAQNLGVDYKIFPIQEIIDTKIQKITQTTGKIPTDFEKQNIQARERGEILSDLAANIGGVFTNNGNKDEVALGYATLYGDVSGALCTLGDLYKTQVYDLARYINTKHGEMIPQGIIDIIPSAELGEDQNVDEGEGDPFNYEFVGKLNQALIEKKCEPYDILEKYSSGTLQKYLDLPENIDTYFPTAEAFSENLEDIWTRLQINFFKRVQSPPILTISKSSFGFEYREAQNGVYFSRKYEELKKQILENK
ncbi:NAD(+) synthase [Candidatus Gracilibacteria bacterium]|nr:NAD(+) synthase [Candidatus Gracilibacteria bacterium]